MNTLIEQASTQAVMVHTVLWHW